VNEWYWLTCALLAGIAACGWVILRRGFLDGIVALQLAGVLASLGVLSFAEAVDRPPFGDLAIVLALVSVVGSVILARFVERVPGGPGGRGGDDRR
jgi:multisubunit Na+/H+ antiporter MnhF subunit